jgi:putative membrane protein
MKRVFGIKSTEAFNLFLSQWMHKSKELEETFENVGQTVETQVGILRFKGIQQDVLFIVPYIHFGPFGNLGGSEFSFLIANEFKDKTCFVFHGTATHDFNPVSSDELSKVVNAINTGIKQLKLEPIKAKLKQATYKTCTAHCIEFEDNSFIGLTRSPHTTEDIEYSIGTSLINKAEQFTKKSIIFDEHNSETGKVEYVISGSPYYTEFIKSIESCLSKKEKSDILKLGVSQKETDIPNIGKAGIKVAMLKTKKTMIWILIDSNGIKPDTKTNIIKEVKSMLKDKNSIIEIMTTDTHEINNIKGVLNPITNNEIKDILPIIKQMVLEAEKNLEEVKGDMIKVPFKINIFGTMHTSELISTINAIVAIAKIALPFILIMTILIILWGLTLI